MNIENKLYETPEAEVVVFAQQDIVTTSDGGIKLPIVPFSDPVLAKEQNM